MRSVKPSWAVLWGACQALSVCAAGAPPPLALTMDSTLSLSSGAATPAPPSAATPAPKPLAVPVFLADEQLRAFNQEDFTLAFDVLLSAGDVERAFRVAQQAVQAVPRDKLWRLKLARVSEWTQRPLVAGEQWRTLFQQGERSDEVVTAVLRLMPLLNDPLMALQAWAERAKHGLAVIYSTSEVGECLSVAHRIVVMSRGRISAEFGPDVSKEQIMAASGEAVVA